MGALALVVDASIVEDRELSARRHSDNIPRVLQDNNNTTLRPPSISTISIKTDTARAKATTNMAMGTTRVMIRVTADSNTTTAVTEEEDLRIKTISRNTTIKARTDPDLEEGEGDRCPAEEAAQ